MTGDPWQGPAEMGILITLDDQCETVLQIRMYIHPRVVGDELCVQDHAEKLVV